MDKKEVARMKRRVRTLQKQLGNLGPVMRGSVVVIGTRNKQPYFSLNKDKKTKLIYLGNEAGHASQGILGQLQETS